MAQGDDQVGVALQKQLAGLSQQRLGLQRQADGALQTAVHQVVIGKDRQVQGARIGTHARLQQPRPAPLRVERQVVLEQLQVERQHLPPRLLQPLPAGTVRRQFVQAVTRLMEAP